MIEYGFGHVTHDEQHLRLHETPECTGGWMRGSYRGTRVVICSGCKRDWALNSVYGRMALAEVKATQIIDNELKAPPLT
jgi:hypothetical protein